MHSITAFTIGAALGTLTFFILWALFNCPYTLHLLAAASLAFVLFMFHFKVTWPIIDAEQSKKSYEHNPFK